MPFRNNHAVLCRCAFYFPVVLELRSSEESVGFVDSSPFADLPDVEDFSPAVQLKAGIPPKSVSTTFVRPSVSDIVSYADSLESAPAESAPVEPASAEPASAE